MSPASRAREMTERIPRRRPSLFAWDEREGSVGLSRALLAVGDEWSLHILRSVYEGHSRFSDFKHQLGIADAVLAKRLRDLVDRRMLDVRTERAGRPTYGLTATSADFWKVAVALWRWDLDWAAPGTGLSRMRLTHRGCGQSPLPVYGCGACGAIGLTPHDTSTVLDRALSVDVLHARSRRGVRGSSQIGRDGVSILGDGWSTALLASAMFGLRRFRDFGMGLPGISPVTLTDRLEAFVRAGLFERVPVEEGGRRQEYRLTQKAKSYFPVFANLNSWAARHHSEDGRTGLVVRHDACGRTLQPMYTCNVCNAELLREELALVHNP